VKAAHAVDELLAERKSKEQTFEAARIGLGAAVRLAARFKEFQASGTVPNRGPILVMPPGTRLFVGPPPPWIPMPSAAPGQVIDVEADGGP
jgi:hypothetical protein